MTRIAFDKDTAMFGWAAPFNLYDPELPCRIIIISRDGAELRLTRGCKLSTLLHALQLRGMEKPGD